MKRFIQVMLQGTSRIDDADKKKFEDRCACAVACGYIPCGNALQVAPNVYSNRERDFNDVWYNKIETEFVLRMVQSFYDPEGNATLICGHCAKCENCKIAPDEDAYCKQFEDACYEEE